MSRLAWRTELAGIEPEHIQLVVGARLRVRVVGWALGFVQCAGQRRFVCGRFDEGFLIAPAGELSVHLIGLTGVRHARLVLRPRYRLCAPLARRRGPPLSSTVRAAVRLAPTMPSVRAPVPRLRLPREAVDPTTPL